jgi:hypothetical protein
MKKKNKKLMNWGDEIRDLIQKVEEAKDELRGYEEETGEIVKGPVSRQRLWNHLSDIEVVTYQIFNRYCRSLAAKLAAHEELTEEDFYLLQAGGCRLWSVKDLGLSPVDDYELHLQCCYEDEQTRTYIFPGDKPPFEKIDKKTGRRHIRIRIGRSPEEISWDNLRESQKKFFQRYLPDVAARFKRG